ncbi:hypothetical protein J4729_04755 [Leisingera sp. HS039]|uniref:hypothetical protein n=1 Tax=unclassified Leisingera TaxID=2614906 RepID=UPI0010710888|nr:MULTISPECIES: hypothetical protein [unclassified Leisingera]MBQ4823859.1 hypothetical protein [Leisingera sp. HS039]QBR35353.1 hypothetical protein ETW23_03530 [Leisingera sp. NJS201]
MIDQDAILWQSARNLLDAQENLNKLYEAFWQVECSDSGLKIEELEEDGSDGEFLQPVWNTYFVHRRNARSNSKAKGIVTIAIQLTADEGTESDWADGKRSKVIVGYWPNGMDDGAWVFTTDGPNDAGYCEEWVAERRFWRREDTEDKSWFYAVPLNLLTDTKCVRELIVAPVHEILRAGPGDVFSKVDDSLAKVEASLCLPPQPSAAG